MKTIVKALVLSVSLAGTLIYVVQNRPEAAVACQRPDFNWDDTTWARERLNGDDWPFTQVSWRVERMFEKTKLEDQLRLVNRLRGDAYRNAQDAQKQFAYAHATFLVARQYGDTLSREQMKELMCGVYFRMALAPSPASFEYARLRYMILCLSAPVDFEPFDRSLYEIESILRGGDVDQLAIRLLERKPDDNVLKYFVVKHTLRVNKTEENQLRLQYAQEVQKAFSKRADSYALLADVWGVEFGHKYSSKAFDRSVSYLQQSKKMLPEVSPNRKLADLNIKFLERRRATLERDGKLKP